MYKIQKNSLIVHLHLKPNRAADWIDHQSSRTCLQGEQTHCRKPE